MNEEFALVRRPVREELKMMVPRAHAHMHIEQALGAAFARLSRGELQFAGTIEKAIEARAQNVLRMTDPLFSRMYVTACELTNSGKLSDDHLNSGEPEHLAPVTHKYSRLKEMLSSEDFFEHAEEEVQKIKGPEVPSEQFITFAAIGLSQIGEVARIAGRSLRMQVSLEGKSDFISGALRGLAEEARTLRSFPDDYKFEPIGQESKDISELTQLLSVIAYVAVQRYAETGNSDWLAGYFRSCQPLLEKHAVSAESLNLPQALEGALQIQAIPKAVHIQRGRPAQTAPFLAIQRGSENLCRQLDVAFKLMPEPQIEVSHADAPHPGGSSQEVAASSEV